MTSRPAQRIRLTTRGAYNSLRLDKRRMIHLDELRYLEGRLGKWVVLRTESARRFRRIHVTRLERSLWDAYDAQVASYERARVEHAADMAGLRDSIITRSEQIAEQLTARIQAGLDPVTALPTEVYKSLIRTLPKDLEPGRYTFGTHLEKVAEEGEVVVRFSHTELIPYNPRSDYK